MSPVRSLFAARPRPAWAALALCLALPACAGAPTAPSPAASSAPHSQETALIDQIPAPPPSAASILPEGERAERLHAAAAQWLGERYTVQGQRLFALAPGTDWVPVQNHLRGQIESGLQAQWLDAPVPPPRTQGLLWRSAQPAGHLALVRVDEADGSLAFGYFQLALREGASDYPAHPKAGAFGAAR